MTSEFGEIFSRFYLKIKDYDLANLEDDILTEMMTGWLKGAVSRPYVRRLFRTFDLDDDLEEIEYTLKFPLTEEEDKDFIEEAIAKGMVIEWLTPNVQTTLNIHQMYGGKETNFFSQAPHAAGVREMLADVIRDQRRYIQDRGYIHNTYLQG